MALVWKSNFTHSEIRIFRGKVVAGLLKMNIWKSSGYGELDGHLLRFKVRGFWQRRVEMTDIDGQRILGEIKLRFFNGLATIGYENQEYQWKYKSWPRRNWAVRNENDIAEFKVKGFWQTEGEIENNEIPAAVILASLFIHFHFRKVAAATH
ncbi:hypothetical protein [Dyadobacter luticola]|uniref:Uncharacterized protein n=1 Tax=Dyadobacter luticola TaxID=1979387 RepID=A0A5R9KNT5_9BACT|nr:hypothetical protein [Dyadobacter luticola]TLU97853.1 hypothetical protein FEN17_23945 [Dyadobacter luticola]